MLITENVLRKIIAEEYKKMVNENSGLTDKEINKLLPLLTKAAGNKKEIEAILDPHIEALKANKRQAFKFHNTVARFYDKNDNIARYIEEFFETNGIEPENPMGYDRKGKYNPNAVPGEYRRNMSTRTRSTAQD